VSDIVLINVSGPDRPGLTSSLMGILAESDVRILDIGQAMIHDTLSLGMLVKIPDEARMAPVLKDVLFHAHHLDLRVRFTPITAERYEQWVRGEEARRYVITLLGRRVTALQIGRIAGVITESGLNIEDIVRLSGRTPLHDEHSTRPACIELTVRGHPQDPDAMKATFLELSQELAVDISFQEETLYRRNRRLVVFDMDSTLIEQEVIDELAAEAGAGEEVSRVTEAAMAGELDFTESLRRRVACLEGLEESVLEKVAGRLRLTEGAERLLGILKSLGYKTAVISGGFDYFGQRLQTRLGLDYMHANVLEISAGRLTGRVVGPVIDGARKAELLAATARQEGLSPEQVVAVGDGANDLPMLRAAGLGIAFHAKPVVQRSARQAISTVGLDGVLYLMGIKDPEHG